MKCLGNILISSHCGRFQMGYGSLFRTIKSKLKWGKLNGHTNKCDKGSTRIL